MKNLIYCLLALSFLGVQAREIEDSKRVRTRNFKIGTQEYRSFLTWEMVKASTDGGPKTTSTPLATVLTNAQKKMTTIDPSEEWNVSSVSLYKRTYYSKEYWYYQISFKGNKNKSYVYLLLTLEGQPAKIIRISEQLI